MICIRSRLRLLVLACWWAATGEVGAQTVGPTHPPPPGPASPAASGAPLQLGRFFFTPAQRAALDEARRRPAAAAKAEQQPLPPPPEYVTLNGVVRRSDGTTTVWLNNKPVRGGQTDDGLQIRSPGRSTPADNVTVRVPQTGQVVNLKVGQQVDVTSGKVEEAYRSTRRAQIAAEPAPAAPQATDAQTPRRTDRDRALLRELLRELDAPASSTEAPSSSQAASTSDSSDQR